MSDLDPIVLTYAPFGAPRATVFAHIAADRWGWQLYHLPYYREGACSLIADGTQP